MTWEVTIGDKAVRIDNEPDPVEAATRALEYIVNKYKKFNIGISILVTNKKEKYTYDSDTILIIMQLT